MAHVIVILVFTSYSSRKPSRHLHLDEYLVRECCHDGIKTVKNNGTETQSVDEIFFVLFCFLLLDMKMLNKFYIFNIQNLFNIFVSKSRKQKSRKQ